MKIAREPVGCERIFDGDCYAISIAPEQAHQHAVGTVCRVCAKKDMPRATARLGSRYLWLMGRPQHKLTSDELLEALDASRGCKACGAVPSTRSLASRYPVSHVTLQKHLKRQAALPGNAPASSPVSRGELDATTKRLKKLGVAWSGKDQLKLAAAIFRAGLA